MREIEERLQALQSTLEGAWRGEGYAEAAFAPLASRVLADASPLRGMDAGAILEWLATRDTRAATERDVDVAGIPLVQSSRFAISLRHGVDGLPAIAAPAWTGAVQVLDEALCSSFSFAPEWELDPKFAIGALTRSDCVLLAPGATLPVESGLTALRQLGHTARVGLSLVVRTTERLGATSLTALAPGVVLDAEHKDAGVARRLRCLDALATVDVRAVESALVAALREDDPRTSFHLLRYAKLDLGQQVDGRVLWDVGQRRFGKHAPLVGATLENEARRAALASLLKRTRARDDRLLLLLANAAVDSNDLDQLIERFLPGRAPALRREDFARDFGDVAGLALRPLS